MFNKNITPESSVILQKVASELLERLALFHYFDPTCILEVGCGRGYCLELLQKTYPKVRFLGLEDSYDQLLKVKRNTHQWFKKNPTFLLGNIEKIQFIDHQFDLICVNLSLLQVPNLEQCLLKIKKILKPNGLLLFTMLGPDTFKELRIHPQCYDAKMVNKAFLDMHSLGDMLVQQKYGDVVVDAHYLDVRYNNFQDAYQDIKQMGFAHFLSDIQPFDAQNILHVEHNNISITWEVLYAQAWCLPSKTDFSNKSSQEISVPLSEIYKK